MTTITIKAIRTIEAAKEWKGGDRLIAMFDCVVSGIAMRECLLILNRKGYALAQVPRGQPARSGEERLFRIVDAGLRRELSDLAYEKYLALRGETKPA